MQAILDDIDINGFQERDLSAGEELVKTNANVVWFLSDSPRATLNSHNERVEFTPIQANDFLYTNYVALRRLGLPDATSSIGAFYRYLSAQAGLISPSWTPESLSVRYIEADQRDEDYNLLDDFNAIPDKHIRDILTPDVKVLIRERFADIVCTMAYVFRSRGHHWKPEFAPLYERILTKCGIDPRTLGVTLEHLFTIVLHHIPPIVLDRYWNLRRESSSVSGPLVKRYDVAAAGSAAFYAIKAALIDLDTIMPTIIDRYRTTFNELLALVKRLKENRWTGSINHRYYGVDRDAPDETLYAGLIATVIGALDVFAPTSPLKASPSLRRVGDNAPLTAAIIGQTLRNIVRSEKFSDKYLTGGGKVEQ
jgi:hypothetical protein